MCIGGGGALKDALQRAAVTSSRPLFIGQRRGAIGHIYSSVMFGGKVAWISFFVSFLN